MACGPVGLAARLRASPSTRGESTRRPAQPRPTPARGLSGEGGGRRAFHGLSRLRLASLSRVSCQGRRTWHLAGYPIPGCLPGILPQPRQGRRTHTDTQRLISRRKQPVGGQLADGQGDTHLTLAGPGSGKARRTRPCRRRSFSSDSLGGVF